MKHVKVTYRSARADDDLDTRLLRAMITKGLIEPVSSAFINLVNADYVAKQRGLRISEERQPTDGAIEVPLETISVMPAILSFLGSWVLALLISFSVVALFSDVYFIKICKCAICIGEGTHLQNEILVTFLVNMLLLPTALHGLFSIS